MVESHPAIAKKQDNKAIGQNSHLLGNIIPQPQPSSNFVPQHPDLRLKGKPKGLMKVISCSMCLATGLPKEVN